MVVTILIIAFAWLLYETDYLRIRLLVGYIPANWTDEYGWSNDYHDYEFTDDLLPAWEWSHTEAQYQAWLNKRNEPKVKYGAIDIIRDKEKDYETMLLKRQGLMLYQRGR